MTVAREIRALPEAEVIRRWAELYVGGKHAGYAAPNTSQYTGRDSMWVEVEVPHALYNADWNTDTETVLSGAQTERAERYARTPGTLPPGIALFKGRRGQRRLYVADGNHRAYAAFLRGKPTARFYVPQNEWRRFQQMLSVSEVA